MRLKSRVKWLKVGDQNTQFFHRVVKGQTIKHKISSLCCEDRLVTNVGSKIKDEIHRFYENLLGIDDPLSSSYDVEQLRDLLPMKLNDDMHSFLIADVSEEEIHIVHKNMPSNKATSPDGYTIEFFRAR